MVHLFSHCFHLRSPETPKQLEDSTSHAALGEVDDFFEISCDILIFFNIHAVRIYDSIHIYIYICIHISRCCVPRYRFIFVYNHDI